MSEGDLDAVNVRGRMETAVLTDRAAEATILQRRTTMKARLKLGIVLCLTRLLVATPASSQAPEVTAFVNVAVIPLDRERVLPHQTVVVRGDRIGALGPATQIGAPARA